MLTISQKPVLVSYTEILRSQLPVAYTRDVVESRLQPEGIHDRFLQVDEMAGLLFSLSDSVLHGPPILDKHMGSMELLWGRVKFINKLVGTKWLVY